MSREKKQDTVIFGNFWGEKRDKKNTHICLHLQRNSERINKKLKMAVYMLGVRDLGGWKTQTAGQSLLFTHIHIF